MDFLDNSNSSDLGIDRDNTSAANLDGNIAPEVFLLNGRREDGALWSCWTAVHASLANHPLIVLELELRHDEINPLTLKKPSSLSREDSEETVEGFEGEPLPSKAGMEGDGFDAFSEEDLLESTTSYSRPIRRVTRSVLKGDESGSMEIFSIISQINEQLNAAEDLASFIKVVPGIIKDITKFHRIMVYQFDEQWNGQVVAELVDWSETKDLFQGLFFPATDIPAQARALYVVNKVRVLYDRDLPTARLVCRSQADRQKPVDMTHSFLRAMSPIHLEYLGNMGVRASMSISIVAFGRLWGLIACHTYGNTSMRCSFLVRKLCRLIGDQISHNIERLSYAARLTARKLVHTPDSRSPSGYIVSKAEDLLGLFDADIGMLSVGDEGRILGPMQNSQEAIALREYFRSKRFETITPSNDLRADFPDLEYAPGFKTVAGVLYIPLSRSGDDFLLFFRRGHLQKVHWAGNPYEKVMEKNAGKAGILLPRQSFKVWSENVVDKCKEWTEDQVETAAVLCLVYGKFIEVWREKQQALQTSKLATLLLNNAGHEVRTPLNAVINYLEIALEGSLDENTRENLMRSHTASQSLVYVINDLLDLTKSEQGQDLFRNEPFDLMSTVREAVSMYRSQATRADVSFLLEEDADIPRRVLGDQAKIRQVIGNVTANALKYTIQGSVQVRTKLISRREKDCEMSIVVQDTGCGISEKKLDAIFSNFELVEPAANQQTTQPEATSVGTGLGLAIVARIVGNMNGQLKAESKVGRGSTFTFVFHFVLPEEELRRHSDAFSSRASTTSTQRAPTASQGTRTLLSGHGRSSPIVESNTKLNNVSPRVSDDNQPESCKVGDEFIWPSEQQHQKHKKESVSSTGMKSVSDQMRDLRSRASGAGDIDNLVNSLISSTSHSQGGTGSTNGSIRALPMSPSAQKSDYEFERASASPSPPMSPRFRSKSEVDAGTLTMDEVMKREAEVADDVKNGGPGDYEGAVSPMSASHDLESPRTTIANNPAIRSVRAVKMNARDVRVPQRYEWNTPNRLAPPRRTKSHPIVHNLAENQLASATQGPQTTPQKKPTEPRSLDDKHLNILIAEDDPINRSILQKRLQIDKHSMVLMNDGSDCYDEFTKNPGKYDIILMDMQMPVLDGMGATRKIRQQEKSSKIAKSGRVPIIAVSASLLESQAQVAIDTGLDGWILKPVNFQRLKVLFEGLKDDQARSKNLYRAGNGFDWEAGGWLTTINDQK